MADLTRLHATVDKLEDRLTEAQLALVDALERLNTAIEDLQKQIADNPPVQGAVAERAANVNAAVDALQVTIDAAIEALKPGVDTP